MVPAEFLVTTANNNSDVTVSSAEGTHRRVDGRMAASLESGLGFRQGTDLLEPPVVEVQ